jgi:hypothetical protein
VSERSIAEIIGHRKIRSLDLRPGDVVEDFEGDRRTLVKRAHSRQGLPGWQTASGWFADEWFEHHAAHVVPIPTPDDMLAWLDGQGYAVEMNSRRNEGDRDIYVTLLPYGSAGQSPDYEGATLHAALEAAVRAVAEATP